MQVKSNESKTSVRKQYSEKIRQQLKLKADKNKAATKNKKTQKPTVIRKPAQYNKKTEQNNHIQKPTAIRKPAQYNKTKEQNKQTQKPTAIRKPAHYNKTQFHKKTEQNKQTIKSETKKLAHNKMMETKNTSKRVQTHKKLEKNEQIKVMKAPTTPKLKILWKRTERKKSTPGQKSFNQEPPKGNKENLIEIKMMINKLVFITIFTSKLKKIQL